MSLHCVIQLTMSDEVARLHERYILYATKCFEDFVKIRILP